jgi:hypothetical protein
VDLLRNDIRTWLQVLDTAASAPQTGPARITCLRSE